MAPGSPRGLLGGNGLVSDVSLPIVVDAPRVYAGKTLRHIDYFFGQLMSWRYDVALPSFRSVGGRRSLDKKQLCMDDVHPSHLILGQAALLMNINKLGYVSNLAAVCDRYEPVDADNDITLRSTGMS